MLAEQAPRALLLRLMSSSQNPYFQQLAERKRQLDAHIAHLQSYAGREEYKQALADLRECGRSPWGDNYGVLGLADEPAALWPHHAGHHGPPAAEPELP